MIHTLQSIGNEGFVILKFCKDSGEKKSEVCIDFYV